MKLPTLSIIIPTYNEEKHLPGLLELLSKQSYKPIEVIIGDNSTDSTREIAKEYGCIITDGPTVGAGRNHGGRIAKGEVLLFLDADTYFKEDFLEKALKEYVKRKLAIAMVHFNYHSKHPVDKVIGGAMNIATKCVQFFYAFTHGFSIMCNKEVFDKINGFNETLKLGEDVDFGHRASKHGKFRVITSTKIWISPRRLIEEGRINLCWKLIRSTAKVLTGGQIKYHDPRFSHRFGHHTEE